MSGCCGTSVFMSTGGICCWLTRAGRKQLWNLWKTWSSYELWNAGVRLYVAETEYACHGVDTPADLERVAAFDG